MKDKKVKHLTRILGAEIMSENIKLREIALGRVEMLWKIESIVNDPSTNDVEKWESIQKVYRDNPDCLTLDFIEEDENE